MTKLEFSNNVIIHTRSLRTHALYFTKDIDEANDLLQDTLLKATRFAEKFNEGTNIKAWLFVIMRNTFINNYRKRSRIKTQLVQEEEITSSQLKNSATQNDAVSSFAMGDIKKALDTLPENYYIPFIRYFEGYKYDEIGKELNLPLGTVKTRIHHARLLLKKQLKYYQKD